MKDATLFLKYNSFQFYIFVVVFHGKKNSDSCCTLGGETE